MDLFDLARICIRRWYVLLPLILLAGLSSILAFVLTKPPYYSNAVIAITLPPTQIQAADNGVGVPRNGLVDAGGEEGEPRLWSSVRKGLSETFPDVKFINPSTFGSVHGRHEQEVIAALPGRLDEYGCDAVIVGIGA